MTRNIVDAFDPTPSKDHVSDKKILQISIINESFLGPKNTFYWPRWNLRSANEN